MPDITHPGRELMWCADPEVHAALRKLDFALQTVPLSGMSQVRQQNLLSFFMWRQVLLIFAFTNRKFEFP
jgi:hypothetical protein